jgi:hypothetical protein
LWLSRLRLRQCQTSSASENRDTAFVCLTYRW